nr:MAG TPA: hypothetical protein [Caudoviricetes sp.]
MITEFRKFTWNLVISLVLGNTFCYIFFFRQDRTIRKIF